MKYVAMMALLFVGCQTSKEVCPQNISLGCPERPKIEIPKIEIPSQPQPPKYEPPKDEEPQGEPEHPSLSDELVEMVSLINEERAKRGLHPLEIDENLNCAAKLHSDDVGPKRSCSHTGSDGSSPWDRAARCNTGASRENIACGQKTAKAAVDAWLKSPGHFKNMMASDVHFIGVAETDFYWTNIFK